LWRQRTIGKSKSGVRGRKQKISPSSPNAGINIKTREGKEYSLDDWEKGKKRGRRDLARAGGCTPWEVV